jgi:hypothetical protein
MLEINDIFTYFIEINIIKYLTLENNINESKPFIKQELNKQKERKRIKLTKSIKCSSNYN